MAKLFKRNRGTTTIGGGVANEDAPVYPEDVLELPWVADPATSWLDYRCWLECELDAGMALHKILPTRNPEADTLTTVFIENPRGENIKGGVNLSSHSQDVDLIQRMASSTYRFILKGFGLRAGYQIPIPGLQSVGGRTVVPEATQKAYNVIVGNLMGGIPLFYAAWELHYILTQTPAPRTQGPVPRNPAFHIAADAILPKAVLLPRTQLDQNAVRALPQAVEVIGGRNG